MEYMREQGAHSTIWWVVGKYYLLADDDDLDYDNGVVCVLSGVLITRREQYITLGKTRFFSPKK